MNSIDITRHRFIYQVAIMLATFAVLFGSTIADLAQDWMHDDNYSHGFLVPLIAAYMIWQKRDQLTRNEIKPDSHGLFIILFGLLVFTLGNIGAELFTMRTALVITVFGLCIYSIGIPITKKIAMPIAYLMFMIPLPAIIWNKIAFPLQLFSARLTAQLVQLMGIPILREGNILRLSNTSLEVVDACSGLRSLTSLLALSAAFAYIAKLNIKNKWFVFLSAIPIAIIVNIIRLTSSALLARYVGPETAQGFLHDISGIITFIAAFIILYALYILIQRSEHKVIKH